MAGDGSRLLAAVVSIGLFAAGCGGQGDVVPVSGRVTLNGQPLAGATVAFQPVSPGMNERPEACGSAGRTDASGQFTLRLIEPDRDGALVGEHIVTISTGSAAGGDAAALKGERLPKAWRDGSQRFEVPAGGTAAANFEVKVP
jgi:hypothetical protein